MGKLKVQSLQHLARNWKPEAQAICKNLVTLKKNPPFFNYRPLYSAVRDMLLFQQPYEQIVKGMYHGVGREKVRDNYLEVLALVKNHFDGVMPQFVEAVGRRYYPVGRGLMVPFDPPLIYGVGGQIYFPWFSFWKSNPVAQERLSLFVTIVDEVLLQDPDLELAKFEILDFSVPKSAQDRGLMVIDAREIPRVSNSRKTEMLEVYAEGYFLAEAELSNVETADKEKEAQPETDDPRQQGLFDVNK